MKQVITLLSLVGIMASCKTATEKPISNEAKVLTISEAAEFAAFTAWKEQKAAGELKKIVATEVQHNKPTAVYVTRPAVAKPITKQAEPVTLPVPAPVEKPATGVQTEPAAPVIPAETVSQPAEKKGWSKAAKGAVIGAGTGAIAGAVFAKKNRVLGAVIGGVAGGGVGYGIGKGMDKKDSRADYSFADF